jgi:hypothetical protein
MADRTIKTDRETDFASDVHILSHADNTMCLGAREWKKLPQFTREMIVEPLAAGSVLQFSRVRDGVTYNSSTYVYSYAKADEFRYARYLTPCRLGRGEWWCYNRGPSVNIRIRDPFDAKVSSHEGFLSLGHDGLGSPFPLDGLRAIGCLSQS